MEILTITAALLQRRPKRGSKTGTLVMGLIASVIKNDVERPKFFIYARNRESA